MAIIAASTVSVHQQASTLASVIAVPAIVVKSEVTTKQTRKGQRHVAQVESRFSLNGIEFTSQRVFFRDRTWRNPGDAYFICNCYPVGTSTTALVPPNAPELAFLERDVDVIPYLGIIIPILGFSLALGVLLLAVWPPTDARSAKGRLLVLLVIPALVILGTCLHFLTAGGELALNSGLTFGIALSLVLLAGLRLYPWAKSVAARTPGNVPNAF